MDSNEPTRLARPAATGTAIAIVAVLAVYLLARSVGDPLAVTQGDSTTAQTIPVVAAIAATLVGGALGLLLAVVARRTQTPRRTLLVAGGVGLLASLAPPFQAAAETSTAWWLVAMHITSAIAVLGALHKALPSRRAATAAGEPDARTQLTA